MCLLFRRGACMCLLWFVSVCSCVWLVSPLCTYESLCVCAKKQKQSKRNASRVCVCEENSRLKESCGHFYMIAPGIKSDRLPDNRINFNKVRPSIALKHQEKKSTNVNMCSKHNKKTTFCQESSGLYSTGQENGVAICLRTWISQFVKSLRFILIVSWHETEKLIPPLKTKCACLAHTYHLLPESHQHKFRSQL